MHLTTPWDVDRSIVREEAKVVLIRFSKYETRLPQAWRLRRKRTREVVAAARAEERAAAIAAGIDVKESSRLDGEEGEENDVDAEGEAGPSSSHQPSATEAEADEGRLETYGLSPEAIRVREEHVRRCAQMDEILTTIAQQTRKFCVVYAVDTEEVPEFDRLYELDDPDESFSLMFFFRNRHLKIDLSTGNNNKVNFQVTAEELLQIIDVAYKGGREGKTALTSDLTFANVSVKRN